jgi:8-oxo-dGTP pyrophosphatase MutT (NUDIX family)
VIADDLLILDEIKARMTPHDWTFARDNATQIDAFWARETALKPKLFDGRVLLQHQAHVAHGVFHAQYVATGYKPFLAWQRMGWPGRPMRNGFAMAALRASDGAYLLGLMGAHTANAGQVYFAAGTPDLEDVLPDGTVDLAGSVLRELEEETGLGAGDVQVGTGWVAVMDTVRVAFMRPVSINLPASEARAVMLARIAAQDDPELSDIVIIRNKGDIADHANHLPRFMARYLTHQFG